MNRTNLQTLHRVHVGTNVAVRWNYGLKLGRPKEKQDILDRFGPFNIAMGDRWPHITSLLLIRSCCTLSFTCKVRVIINHEALIIVYLIVRCAFFIFKLFGFCVVWYCVVLSRLNMLFFSFFFLLFSCFVYQQSDLTESN